MAFCSRRQLEISEIDRPYPHVSVLPDAAKGIQKSKEYQSIKTDTRSLISELGKVLNDRKVDIFRIAKEKHQVIQTIKNCRKKINRYFDDLERNTLVELDQKEREVVATLSNGKKYLESTTSIAQDVLKQLESFKGYNECDLFVQVKTGLQFLNETLKKLNNMCKTDAKPSIQFEIDISIEEYVASLESLGSVSTAHVQTTLPVTTCQHMPLSRMISPIQNPSVQDVQRLMYTLQKSDKYNIHETSDTSNCDIVDICQMLDGVYLITDFNNKKLKRMDESLTLHDSVQLPYRPCRVCVAGPGQAAVSLLKDKIIQFISVGKKMIRAKLFTVGNYCRGIEYIRNELFVCCGQLFGTTGCIKVFNSAGGLQHTVARAPQKLPAGPDYITVSGDGQHLFVTYLRSDNVYMLDPMVT